jgi:hypothetical protein
MPAPRSTARASSPSPGSRLLDNLNNRLLTSAETTTCADLINSEQNQRAASSFRAFSGASFRALFGRGKQ